MRLMQRQVSLFKMKTQDNVDTEYFKTSIGDGTYSEENLQKFWEDAYEQNINEMKEGAGASKK